jgi:hypothetical protein
MPVMLADRCRRSSKRANHRLTITFRHFYSPWLSATIRPSNTFWWIPEILKSAGGHC